MIKSQKGESGNRRPFSVRASVRMSLRRSFGQRAMSFGPMPRWVPFVCDLSTHAKAGECHKVALDFTAVISVRTLINVKCALNQSSFLIVINLQTKGMESGQIATV